MKCSDLRYVPARHVDRASGLMGWVALTLESDLRIESIAVRRTRDGRYTLSFPSRRDGRGVERAIVRPLTQVARDELEAQVIAYLTERGYLSP